MNTICMIILTNLLLWAGLLGSILCVKKINVNKSSEIYL